MFDGQFAVLDGPDSRRWVTIPSDGNAAIDLRNRHNNRFWCASAAGGCGTPLTLKVGLVRRPYFAHLMGQGAGCPLRHDPDVWERSYLHLALQDCLRRWLSTQNRTGTLEAPLPGGGRADLLVVHIDESDQSIEVQLSPIDIHTWSTRTERYLTSVDRVSWVFGPKVGLTVAAHVVRHQGYALHVRLRDQVLEDDFDPGDPTMVEIGTQIPAPGSTSVRVDAAIEWLTLDKCTFTNEYGITTPLAQEAAEAHRRRQAAATAAAELRAEKAAEQAGQGGEGGKAPTGTTPPAPGTVDQHRTPGLRPNTTPTPPPAPPATTRQPPADPPQPLPSRPRGTGRDALSDHRWLAIFDAAGAIDYQHPVARELDSRIKVADPEITGLWDRLAGPVRQATIAMAYIVTRVEAGGPTWRLSFPDIEDNNAVETILTAVGLVDTYTGSRGVRRWKRA